MDREGGFVSFRSVGHENSITDAYEAAVEQAVQQPVIWHEITVIDYN